MEARLKTGLFVSAALRRADMAGRPGVVIRKGDPDAGGVLVLLRGPGGMMVLSQMRATDGALAWMRATGVAPVGEDVADAYVARQRQRDPDLWVVEFDSPDFVPPFEAKILP